MIKRSFSYVFRVVDDLPIDLRVGKLRAGECYYYLYSKIFLPLLFEEIGKALSFSIFP